MNRAPLRLLRGEIGVAFALAAVITLFINVGMLFVPLYDMILYDRVLLSQNMDTVTMLTVGVVAGMTLYGMLEFCRSSLFVLIADRLARRLNVPTLQAALTQSLAGQSSTAAQAMRDLNELRQFASGSAAVIPLDILWTPALVLVLWMLHPAYGLYGLVCGLILFVLSALSDVTTRRNLLAANAANAASLNDLSAALRNNELLDGMGMLPEVARRWQLRQKTVLDQLDGAMGRNRAFAMTAKVLRLAMQAGVVTVGVILVMRYEASPGSMMGANLLIAKLLLPFEQLITAWRQWTSAIAAWRRVRELVRGAGQAGESKVPSRIEGRLVVERLRFQPPEAKQAILRDVSFTIEPGEAVGIIGPSGSGKSTLARLIMGVFPPTSGQVRLDNIPVDAWDRAAFGRTVGYLPQSIALLDGTIVDNIARMQEADPAPAMEAARRADVHDLIGRLPDGYSTWIGGAGLALSGGQRQRVALARALYGSPKLLVLDEPNSHLDHVGEQALIRAILAAKREGTAVLLVTHRPAVLAVMDRVLVLEGGTIARTERPNGEPAAAPGKVAPLQPVPA